MTVIVFVLFPGVTQLDMTGPAQVLSRLPGSRVAVVAASADPVATDSGFALLPTATFAQAPTADILCVPGGHGVVEALAVTAGIDFALTLVAREAGQAVAESIQLALEYDPHPPFDSGTPVAAGERRTAALRSAVYDAAAARMESALRAGASSPQ
jgi:transcriptional regulator GlxA family with amidase domain